MCVRACACACVCKATYTYNVNTYSVSFAMETYCEISTKYDHVIDAVGKQHRPNHDDIHSCLCRPMKLFLQREQIEMTHKRETAVCYRNYNSLEPLGTEIYRMVVMIPVLKYDHLDEHRKSNVPYTKYAVWGGSGGEK